MKAPLRPGPRLLAAGWWDKVPKPVREAFERKVLREGYIHFEDGRTRAQGFFRNVYQILVLDGKPLRVNYRHDPRNEDRPPGARITCTCGARAADDPCPHMAAALFHVYSGPGIRPRGEGYAESPWAHMALGICRTSGFADLAPVLHEPDGSLLRTPRRETVLRVAVTPEMRRPWPAVSLLPTGWVLGTTGGEIGSWVRRELSPYDQQAATVTGHAPSQRAEYGPVGEVCRLAYLEAPRVSLRLDWNEDRGLFRVTAEGLGEGAGLRGEAYLAADQAFSLRNRFPDTVLGAGFPESPEDWSRGLQIRVEPGGGLRIRPFAQGPDGRRLFPDPAAPEVRFGAMLRLPGFGFRSLRAGETALLRRYTGWKTYAVEAAAVPEYLDRYAADFAAGAGLDLDPVLRQGSQAAPVDRLVLRAEERAGGRVRIGLRYAIGGAEYSLADLRARREAGQACLLTPEGRIDFASPEWAWLGKLPVDRWAVDDQTAGASVTVWLEPALLLRLLVMQRPRALRLEGSPLPELRALPGAESGIEGGAAPAASEARAPLPVEGLRPYQVEGLRWLAHLVDCGVSGILADDMGLGKTHQVMSLLAWLHALRGGTLRALVVCPTSVLYHWQDKLAAHHPGLEARLYYGPARGESDLDARVAITSYGVLRKDSALLRAREFDLLVLDEFQNAKNRDSETHRSLAGFPARSLLGLSGTPLENSPLEVKNLFDLLLPGYFPGESQFRHEVLDPLETGMGEAEARERFRRLCRPFILRRTKGEVLRDLPEKVEETYHCDLAPDQAALYRECLEKRGGPLLRELREAGPGNLLHIFQLLNHLKQICNHPLSLAGAERDGEDYGSGKWDLFHDLLDQALESGSKVVVFSQYLGMLSLIDNHLARAGIGHAVLTGSTRDRAAVLARFRDEAACRVFCCSLKAGGVGIDLTAASTVIHYDRWWNAARENQATDRVHRIGQGRNVQVFKLVTRGTLEERIDAIIRRKAAYMDSLLPEDGEGTVRIFSRDELIDLLGPPDFSLKGA